MPIAEHLLEQAGHLAKLERTRPRQASLRRAVSTAYYALFHLLTQEAAQNWRRAAQRPLFERVFEHARMKGACIKKRDELRSLLKTIPPPSNQAIAQQLLLVVEAFAKSQESRHKADYDNSATWRREQVLAQVSDVAAAFRSWKAIRDEDLAQDFLISLFVKDR